MNHVHEPPSEEFIEMSLLLPVGQLEALEGAAAWEGLTVGQLIRRLIAARFPTSKDSREQGEKSGPNSIPGTDQHSRPG